MNLVRAEVARIFSRRFVQLMLLLLLATFCLTILVVLAKSKEPSDHLWESARDQAATINRERLADYNACLNNPTQPTAACDALHPEDVQPEEFLFGVFNFSREIEDLVYFLTAFLAFFGFVVAASSIGSELHTGSVINLLLWRPNRSAVLGAKMAVALGFVAVVSAVSCVIYVATFFGIAAWVGYVGDVSDPYFWFELTLRCVRGIILALVLSTVGFAIATIGRHTAAAFGTLFGYVIVWELGARLVWEALNIGNNTYRDKWFLANHVIAWMIGRAGYSLTSFADSILVLAGIVATLTALAFTSFRRRDIT